MTDYKRLMERDEFGNADIIGIDSVLLYENLTGEEYNKLTNALNRLAKFEDMIEQGLLVKLPCKVGDKVYQTDGVRIYQGEILSIDIEKNFTIFYADIICFDERAIGETVFLTKAEAEARLAELRGGE